MKLRNYALTLAEKVEEQTNRLHGTIRMAALSGMTTAMLAVPTIVAHAEDVSGSGSSMLTGDVLTAITTGFNDLAATCSQVVSIATVTAIGVVGVTAAAKYATKKIKGVLSAAA